MEISSAGIDMGKRILIVIPNLKIGGGAERIAAEVGTKLNERGHDVSFLTIYDEKPMYDFEGELTVLNKERADYPLEFSWNVFRTAKKINEVCERRGIETVISFLLQGNLSAVLSKMLFRNEARIVVSVRNNPLMKEKKEQEQVKWLYPKADKVVALSKGVEHILQKDFSLQKTTTIYNLQDIDKFRKLGEKDVKKEHESFFDNHFVFITVGSLTKQKGHWYLLRCFKRVVEHNENTALIILGEGELREKLEKLSNELNLNERVFMPGNVENVFPYLRRSDCFVLPSIYEGFGNVITEALSQDLPVISTDCVAGPREILCPELDIGEEVQYPYLGEYGILSEDFENKIIFETLEEKELSREEKKFAEAMEKLRNDRALLEEYSNGLERAKDFSTDKIIEEWEQIVVG